MSKMNEHAVQNAVRLALSEARRGVYWRVNVGQAWTGSQVVRNADGSVTIRDARPFYSGVPAGFPDLFGFTHVPVTAAHVGTTLPVYTGIEVKRPGGKASPKQTQHLTLLANAGAICGIAHSADEALALTSPEGCCYGRR